MKNKQSCFILVRGGYDNQCVFNVQELICAQFLAGSEKDSTQKDRIVIDLTSMGKNRVLVVDFKNKHEALNELNRIHELALLFGNIPSINRLAERIKFLEDAELERKLPLTNAGE